jgi:hypothetical protein
LPVVHVRADSSGRCSAFAHGRLKTCTLDSGQAL